MKRYSINKNNTERWKTDVQESVAFYNDWFLEFAPGTYIQARQKAIDKVECAFQKTDCFNMISIEILKDAPEIIKILRMATTPPLARDRLIGLSDVTSNFIGEMEKGLLPPKMGTHEIDKSLKRIITVINRLVDTDIMPWIKDKTSPNKMDTVLAKHVIADRVCGSLSDPIIRNEQERRQIRCIKDYLNNKGYRFIESKYIADFRTMETGTYSIHLNVPAIRRDRKGVNMPIDVVIKRQSSSIEELPVLVECKSAGDFTNTNKRRKEEATKIEQLKLKYGENVEFILFLCGYFDSSYLGYEAAEGIDWIWEHRIDDFAKARI